MNIMNEASLENLSLPNKKKEGHGHRYTIPTAKIDTLFACLADDDSLKDAAKKADVSYGTAKKYYEHGDPNRGIQPLRTRLTIYQEKISEKMNALCEEQRMARLGFVNEAVGKMEEQMLGKKTVVGEDGQEKIVQGELPVFRFSDYERMCKLQMHLMGGVKSKVAERKIMSAEDISGGG